MAGYSTDCPACGRQISMAARYCSWCGVDVRDDSGVEIVVHGMDERNVERLREQLEGVLDTDVIRKGGEPK